MRVELIQLHYGHHLYQFQRRPQQIQTVLLLYGLLILLENIGQQEHDQLPQICQQFCQFLGACSQDQNADAEEN